MGTRQQLKARIISELSRDDLEDDLASLLETHIGQACEFYADTKFWFNSLVTTVATTPGLPDVTIPATIRIVERVTLPAQDIELQEVPLDSLCETSSTAYPREYAYYNDKLRLSPTPSGAFTLNVYGIQQVAAPASDSDSNIWTTEAYDLITAHVKMTLCRSVFRDTDGFKLFSGERADALSRLQRETTRRLVAPLRVPRDVPKRWFGLF